MDTPFRNTLPAFGLAVALAFGAGAGLAACDRQPAEPPPPTADPELTDEEQAALEAQYREEAAEQIDEDSADEVLDALERELAEDD